MRLFAVHDEAGNIEQVVRCPSDSPILIVTPPTGCFYTECEPPEGFDEGGDLGEIVQGYRVDASRAKATLVQRTDSD